MTDVAGPVLIAGGGIAGLAAALAFAQHSIPSEVLEREADFSETGAGIQLGPNAQRILDSLGAAEFLQPLAITPRTLAIHDGVSGKTLTNLPLGQAMRERFGAPYWTVHRGDLLNALLTACRAQPLITLSCGFDVTSLEQNARGVGVASSSGKTRRGSLLIACDGRWSTVRRLALGEIHLPFSGYVAYRAVIASPAVPSSLRDDNVHVWLAPGCHVVHYPVRAGRQHALIVVLEEPGASESWSAHADSSRVQNATSRLAGNLHTLVGTALEWRKWALSDPAPFASWTNGRVVLAGDAAHPVLPFLAQGGGLALEDAVVLAAAVASNRGQPQMALANYQAQRLARAKRVQTAARRNGRIYHMSGLPALARNAVLSIVPPRRLMTAYDWLYGWQAD